MVRPTSFSVVASTLLALIPIHTIAASVDLAFTVRLAQETYDRLVVAPASSRAEEVVKEDEETGKREPKEESTSTTANGDGDHAEEEDKNLTYDGSDLIVWINENGGVVHSNARIGLDPTGQYRGVFVKNLGEEGGSSDGIKQGEVVGSIPWDLIVKPENYHPKVYSSCESLHEMHRQFVLGDESPHAPYINYLKNQPRGRIPDEWTTAGKDLLQTILNHETLFDDRTGVGMPPGGTDLGDYQETWIRKCQGEDTELARAAYFQFASRDEDTLMVPFYDMHNHSNEPKKLNTISHKPEKRGKPFLLRSIRDIAPGEQIFISYNRCNRCWFDPTYKDCVSHSFYGTSELFFVFGFVEDYPQTWDYRMKLDENRSDNLVFHLKKTADGQLQVTFGDNYSTNLEDEKPLAPNIIHMGKHLARLTELASSMKGDTALQRTMPQYEWDMAWIYQEALMTSMSAAILASRFADDIDSEKDERDSEDDYSDIASEDDSDDDSKDDNEDSDDDSEDDNDDSYDDSGDGELEKGRDEL